MTREIGIKLFGSQKVRSVWDAEKMKWFFQLLMSLIF